jgi:hypothetical protein
MPHNAINANIEEIPRDPPPLLEDEPVAITCANACADCGGVLQTIVYVMVPEEGVVTLNVPLTGLLPAQPSPDSPPLATQLNALLEFQVSNTAWPTVTFGGVAVRVTVGTVINTVSCGDVFDTPSSAQLKP